eukprot:COSAG05_NODE_9717_length_606_cov_1.325444_1_plen_49_part_01
MPVMLIPPTHTAQVLLLTAIAAIAAAAANPPPPPPCRVSCAYNRHFHGC